jgi:hypothetical protein
MKEQGRLLDVAAIVVSNLCVAYIMNEKNPEAEELMKQLEREEAERAAVSDGSSKPVRSCYMCCSAFVAFSWLLAGYSSAVTARAVC